MEELALGFLLATKEFGGVLALDFDDVERELVIKEVERLQEKFKLGRAMLMQSSGPKNHHVLFFWNHLSWDRIIEVLEGARLVDPEFVEFKKGRGKLRIRIPVEAFHVLDVLSPHHDNRKLNFPYYYGYLSALEAVKSGGLNPDTIR